MNYKNVLIVGANYINKGAQSMLFIAVDEIKKRLAPEKIYFATFENNKEFKDLKFDTVFYNPQAVRIALDPSSKNRIILKTKLKNLLKTAAGSRYSKFTVPTKDFAQLSGIIKDISLIVDVSGFGLGDKWGVIGSERYLDNIRLAKKYRIPMVLMPQSFGNFNYKGEEGDKVKEHIRTLLRYPFRIYARENAGYELLTKEYGLKNVVKSYDLVLQNKGIDLDNIFFRKPELHDVMLPDSNNVAIIPNVQCFRHGDRKMNLKMYNNIIKALLKANKNVYLIFHASEDRDICIELYDMFKDNEHVNLIDRDFSCLEYDKAVSKFDYIICSRFHGIVHAYRNSVPCVVLGWAVKYAELTSCLVQQDFCFDITDLNDELINRITEKIADMEATYSEQRKIITQRIEDIQRENCFDVLSQK